MKTVGLITEYNPFHNGHLYHLKKARELTSADYCIVVMSGSFVQRGAPAIFDKYRRTRMALAAGADLVLEMPVMFSTSSAREFASYGISLLDRLGVVDSMCFGSECGDISLLNAVAAILSKETEEYSFLLRDGMKIGLSFPQARSHAMEWMIKKGEKGEAFLHKYQPDQLKTLLEEPNNILGIEYCQAIQALHSKIRPVTITRCGSAYHSGQLEGVMGSALAIRNAIAQGKTAGQLSALVPAPVLPYLEHATPVFPNDLSASLNFKILELSQKPGFSDGYLDMSEDLAARLGKSALHFGDFDSRIRELKSRQYTYTRVSRALIHLLLEIKTEDFLYYKSTGYAPYGRILGFRKQAGPLLSEIKSKSSVPVITKLSDAEKKLDLPSTRLLKQEIYASHLYQMIRMEKGGNFENEYTMPIAVL